MKKLVHPFGEEYGIIGTYSGFKDYYVGDIVEIKGVFEPSAFSVICENDGEYFAFGWRPRSLQNCEVKNNMVKVFDYKLLDTKLMRKCKYKLFIV